MRERGYPGRMKRVAIGAVLLGCMTACSSLDAATSPAGQCLSRHGWTASSTGHTATFEKDGRWISIGMFDGQGQPVDRSDLRQYQAAGCS